MQVRYCSVCVIIFVDYTHVKPSLYVFDCIESLCGTHSLCILAVVIMATTDARSSCPLLKWGQTTRRSLNSQKFQIHYM